MYDAHRLQEFKRLKFVGATSIWQLKGAPNQSAFFYTCGMAIDMDGARRAYAPPGTPGALDNLANAGHAGNWWGIQTHNGQPSGLPILQRGGLDAQPERGFYISPTSLQDKFFFPTDDVRRYIDAQRIPYIALPYKHLRETGVRLGDFVFVMNARTGKCCYAIHGDNKNKPNLGESSIGVADLIGVSSRRNGGATDGIFFMVFPDSGLGQGTSPGEATIQQFGRLSMAHFSRFRDKENTLTRAYPEYPVFKRALEQAGY